MSRTRRFLLVAFAVSLLSACGVDDAGEDVSGGPGSTTTAPSGTEPTGTEPAAPEVPGGECREAEPPTGPIGPIPDENHTYRSGQAVVTYVDESGEERCDVLDADLEAEEGPFLSRAGLVGIYFTDGTPESVVLATFDIDLEDDPNVGVGSYVRINDDDGAHHNDRDCTVEVTAASTDLAAGVITCDTMARTDDGDGELTDVRFVFEVS